jgi:ABC-type nitrate/sulfonate/bicarbonate transport system ATPase subunit
LAAVGVSKSFLRGRRTIPVLDAVSIEVPSGGWVSVIGPSGCGKTTLLRIMAGLVVPDGGRILVGAGGAGDREGMAYMPQSDTLLPWRTALDNAVLGPEVDGRPRGKAQEEARALFDRFGLSGSEHLYPHQLSGGMRQRVALMRTFLCQREVLLLDEPLGSLDALTRATMQGWLCSVWQELGHSVLLVTHDIEEAIILSDRLYLLSAGPARVVSELGLDWPRPRRRSADATVLMKARILDQVCAEASHP